MFYNNDVNRKVRDVINWKKGEAHAVGWLYIEVDDDQLIEELKISKKERTTVRLAMTNCLMEGDRIILDNKDNYAVRYYVDNLDRRRIRSLRQAVFSCMKTCRRKSVCFHIKFSFINFNDQFL